MWQPSKETWVGPDLQPPTVQRGITAVICTLIFVSVPAPDFGPFDLWAVNFQLSKVCFVVKDQLNYNLKLKFHICMHLDPWKMFFFPPALCFLERIIVYFKYHMCIIMTSTANDSHLNWILSLSLSRLRDLGFISIRNSGNASFIAHPPSSWSIIFHGLLSLVYQHEDL